MTSTNTSGPPLLLYLLGRGDAPDARARHADGLPARAELIGAVALVATGTSGAVPRGWLVAVFVPLVLARAPRRAAAVRAGSRRRGGYEPVLNATLVVAVVAAS